ncbi:MAG TPA: AraC family transcriptional regulator [Chitinophagaceae bacterium]|nr:AraC family transcriptional regulator [Chitinophagaceae bacterium]
MINTYDFQVEHPEMFSQLAVKDLLFLYYKCPQEEKKINLYTHFNKIIFVLEGKKMIRHRDHSWLLTNDKAIFVKKTAYNQERFWEVDWEVLCFYCPDTYLRQVFSEYRLHFPLNDIPAPSKEMLIEINVNETTRAFFYSIVPYFRQKPKPAEDLLALKFKELIFSILSNPANTGLLSYVNNISDQHKPLLQDIMETNFTFNLSLAEFARIAQRSLAAFKRDFNEIYHTSPGKWLSQKRLEYAKHLLNSSKKNVNEIAYDSGFENVTHFSRVFKEKFGLSPLQCRKEKYATPLVNE